MSYRNKRVSVQAGSNIPIPAAPFSPIKGGPADTIFITPTIFGDALGNNGDYSRGIFYGGRRKYLSQKNAGPGGVLGPPVDFMTRRQKRNHVKIEREGIVLKVSQLDFKKQGPELDETPSRIFVQNKNKAAEVKTIVIEKYKSVDPEDWLVEQQAGCTYYVHKYSGEFSSVKPWEDIGVRGRRGPPEPIHDEEGLGTGHLAYDKRPINDLLDQLIQESNKK